MACWFWRRRSLKIIRVFLLFCDYLPLEKSNPLHLKNLDFPSTKDDLCQVWLNWSSGSGKEVKNVKVYGRTDRRPDRRTTDNQIF
jgi:hypothetical protein